MMTVSLDEVLRHDLLRAVFQPIIAIGSFEIVGYEALIRGPTGSSLESPAALFARARAEDRQLELEQGCLRTIWTQFCALGLAGKLFLNVSAEMLLAPPPHQRVLIDYLADLNVDAHRVIIELTEEHEVTDFRRLRRIARHLNRQGFSLAIDDLGAGFASLRLWLELRPVYVKIDIVFIQGIEENPVKRAFLRSINDIARACGSGVIAEGIETAAEFDVVRCLGIANGQGFYIARPSAIPPLTLKNVHRTSAPAENNFCIVHPLRPAA